jgi:2-dehydro-3-deoxyphosphogluconate aldolase / (4S)-4-hydroxy-2-oxoglutarate aldolase
VSRPSGALPSSPSGGYIRRKAEATQPEEQAVDIGDVLERARIVPVLTIERAEDAVPLARALAEGGLRTLEITLRTEAAAGAVRAIRAALPDLTLGCGTLTRPEDFDLARDLGVAFAVSPGLTPRLAEAARAAGLPYLPAAATVSEALLAREAGFATLKFFPAELAGGVRALDAFRPLLPDVRFCPTGGVSAKNAAEYLAQPNVIAVGGTWVAPADAVRAGDWSRITALAKEATVRA